MSLVHRLECGGSAVLYMLRGIVISMRMAFGAGLFIGLLIGIKWVVDNTSQQAHNIGGGVILAALAVGAALLLRTILRNRVKIRRRIADLEEYVPNIKLNREIRTEMASDARRLFRYVGYGLFSNRTRITKTVALLAVWVVVNGLVGTGLSTLDPTPDWYPVSIGLLVVTIVFTLATLGFWSNIDKRGLPSASIKFWGSLITCNASLALAGLLVRLSSGGWNALAIFLGSVLLIPLILGFVFQCSEPSLIARMLRHAPR